MSFSQGLICIISTNWANNLCIHFTLTMQLFSIHVLGNSCPKHWSYLAGYCYFFSNDTATWLNARQRCQETGGDLVKVSSDAQNAFVASRYSSARCLTDGTWLGLRRNPNNLSQWVWLDDFDVEPKYTKWHRKEPMNDRLDKNCTEIHPSKSIYWYGRECSARGCYICVKGKYQISVFSKLANCCSFRRSFVCCHISHATDY